MTRNTLLRITIILCKVFRVLSVLFFFAIITVTIWIQIAPSDFETIKIKKQRLIYMDNNYIIESDNIQETAYYLSEIKTTSLYFNCIKSLIMIFLIYLCITELQKVIYSLRDIQTFQKRNVLSFRKIGKYLLVVFIFSIIDFWIFSNGGFFSLTINLTFLILSLTTFVLAEIFKEGNKLYEEHQLTV